MPLMLPTSSATPFGIAATAARNSALFNEPARKLPERPRIVVMTLTSRVVRPRRRVYADRRTGVLRAGSEVVAYSSPAVAGFCDEHIGRCRTGRARVVLMGCGTVAQQRIDDAPRFEDTVLAR